ncbi:MAG: DUF362 domain-containing protein, partial [Polyangiales bacterium]
GCPVSVAEQVLTLVTLGGLKNPYFDGENIVGFNKAYLSWKAKAAANRLRGIPYQKAGPTQRGDGAPKIDPHTASYSKPAADAEE